MHRRYELDWLRVLLFAILVLHHIAVGFIGIGTDIYGFANNELGGPFLNLFVYFSHTWRLPTLFLISGVGTYFASRKAGRVRFLHRRTAKLIIPALFGTFVLNSTYGYAIAWKTEEAAPSYLSFLTSWIASPEPTQVGHLWFLYNLAIYTVVCWPLYSLLSRKITFSVPLLLSILAAGATLIMVAFKPFLSAIAGDGYQLPWYLWIFASGYVIGANHERVLSWLAQRAWLLTFGGVIFFTAEIALLAVEIYTSPELGLALAQGGWASAGLEEPFDSRYVLFTVISGLNTWFWCLAFFGLASRYLKKPGPALNTLSPAVFPVYVLHFPITIIGLALLAEINWPWQLKFFLLAIAVYGLSWLLYLILKRTGPAIYLFGGRLADKQRPATGTPL